jgi:hypothetical protein
MRRLTLLVLSVLCLPGCVATAAWPWVLSPGDVRARPTTRGDWIASWEESVASIAAIMTGDLELPAVSASLHFYRDRDTFRGALEANGYDPAFARETAATLTAVSGPGRVLINEGGLAEFGWHYRVGILAHELTHTLQYDFGGGTRGTSEQWLREGFAEWVEVRVLSTLDFTSPAQARSIAVSQVKSGGTPAALSQMVTFPDWVALAQRAGQEPIYAQALLAVEFLLARHGVAKAIEYFTLFATSEDRLGNFRRAFGEDLHTFEAAWRVELDRLLGR